MLTRPKPPLPSLAHLVALTDDVGIIQHATYDVPNRSTGYCTDDVSRAFMVALAAAEADAEPERALRLAGTYLAFLHDAQCADGRFHNFMGYDRNWQDAVGGGDAFGRAVWALGYGMRHAPRESWRRVCARLLRHALPQIRVAGPHLRPYAYALLGLAHAYQAGDRADFTIRELIAWLAERLLDSYEEHRAADWCWLEGALVYDNARLCEALLRAGEALDDPALIDAGAATLRFYAGVVIEDGIFVPIGNDGWYVRGGRRARYGQQPLEAAALVDAALAAFAVASDPEAPALVRAGHEWFLGRNSAGAVLVEGGGCCDGIDAGRVNPNMGAESTLAYLASAFAVAGATSKVVPLAR